MGYNASRKFSRPPLSTAQPPLRRDYSPSILFKILTFPVVIIIFMLKFIVLDIAMCCYEKDYDFDYISRGAFSPIITEKS